MANRPLYPYRVRPPMVVVRGGGPFDLERSIETLDALEKVRAAGGPTRLVWDVRRRSTFPLAGDVRELIPRLERWERVAILTNRQGQYAMARLAELLTFDRARACLSTREAQAWVRGEIGPR